MLRRLPHDFVERAKRPLNLADFASASAPQPVFQNTDRPTVDRQYILRMMLRSNTLPLSIPDELDWLRYTIYRLNAYQRAHGLFNPFIYVTVRHGVVTSATDDEWHVDGFSMRTMHVPEQNYICASVDPTEFLVKQWEIPATFDPFVHNIHHYFRDWQDATMVGQSFPRPTRGLPEQVYAIDPYCVHRRPTSTIGKIRTFWRISFVPIEILDDTCTPNPLFPPVTYGNVDIRNKLVAWPNGI
jgi:hypothetical protein